VEPGDINTVDSAALGCATYVLHILVSTVRKSAAQRMAQVAHKADCPPVQGEDVFDSPQLSIRAQAEISHYTICSRGRKMLTSVAM
jgi:hypothetical protein